MRQIMSRIPTGKNDFEIYIKSLADTTLFELAKDIIKKNEQENTNYLHDSQWQNRFIYTEFCNRNKVGAYYMAYNTVMLQIGKPRSVIKS